MRPLWIGCCIVLGVVLGACTDEQPPTRVVVVVRLDSQLRAAGTQLVLKIVPLGGKPIEQRKELPADEQASVVLIPKDSDATRSYVLRADVYTKSDERLASLELFSSYVPNQTRFVTLQLQAGCVSDQTFTFAPEQLGATRDAPLEVVACKASAAVSDAGVDGGGEPEGRAAREQGADTKAVDAEDSGPPRCEEGSGMIDGRCQKADPCERASGRCEDKCELRAGSAFCVCNEGGIVKPHNIDQCWHWTPAERVVDSAAGAMESNLAMNRAGVAVAVWFEGESPTRQLWASRFEPNVGFREAVLLTREPGDYAGFVPLRRAPAVAVDNDGNALVLVERENAELVAFALAKGDWPSVTQQPTPGNGHRYAAWVKRDPKGGFYVASASGSIGNLSWWLRHFTIDGQWGGVVALEPEQGVPFDFVAFDAAETTGALAFLWEDADGAVWGSQLDFAPPYVVTTRQIDGVSHNGLLAMAVSAAGTARGVWQRGRDDDILLMDAYASDIVGLATQWSAPSLVAMQLEMWDYPRVVWSSAGASITAWIQREAMGSRVFSGDHPEALEPSDEGNSSDLQLCADGKGNVLAAWSRAAADGSVNVMVARYDGAAWSGARQLNDSSAGPARVPRIASDQNGDALVIWEQERQLWSRRLE